MTDLIVVESVGDWDRLKALVLDSVSSPITRRVYNMALDEFIAWFKEAPRPGFSKATVSTWRVSLEAAVSARPQSSSGCRPFASLQQRLRTTDYSIPSWRPASVE